MQRWRLIPLLLLFSGTLCGAELCDLESLLKQRWFYKHLEVKEITANLSNEEKKKILGYLEDAPLEVSNFVVLLLRRWTNYRGARPISSSKMAAIFQVLAKEDIKELERNVRRGANIDLTKAQLSAILLTRKFDQWLKNRRKFSQLLVEFWNRITWRNLLWYAYRQSLKKDLGFSPGFADILQHTSAVEGFDWRLIPPWREAQYFFSKNAWRYSQRVLEQNERDPFLEDLNHQINTVKAHMEAFQEAIAKSKEERGKGVRERFHKFIERLYLQKRLWVAEEQMANLTLLAKYSYGLKETMVKDAKNILAGRPRPFRNWLRANFIHGSAVNTVKAVKWSMIMGAVYWSSLTAWRQAKVEIKDGFRGPPVVFQDDDQSGPTLDDLQRIEDGPKPGEDPLDFQRRVIEGR